MSKIFGGGQSVKFVEPKPVAPPAPAAPPVAAPITEVDTGGDTSGDSSSTDALRKKYRPSSTGIGSTGTGLSV